MVAPSGDDLELHKTYDKAFEAQANDKNGWPGVAHEKGLRAVYLRGRKDALEERGKAHEGEY